MSNGSDSLWVVAVIAVAVLVVPVAMIGFPAAQEDSGVEIVLDCSVMGTNDWTDFVDAMGPKGWSVVSGEKKLVKDYPEDTLYNDFRNEIMSDMTSFKGGIYHTETLPYILNPKTLLSSFVEDRGNNVIRVANPA